MRTAGKDGYYMKYTKQDIFRMVEEEDVEFIRLQFTDMFGVLKNVAITSSQLGKALDNKCMFDGSSVEGFVRIEESDMYLYPDYDTFEIFPWRPQQGKVARLICDVYTPNGKPFEGDPRWILKKVINEAKDMGYIFEVGPECEFFLFHTDDNGLPTTLSHEKAGYFDLGPTDLGENVRRDMVLTLDNIMTFKLTVKTIAKRHGLYATFMPKPKYGINGSGMHVNMSLATEDGKNIFADDSDKLGLSEDAYHFIAGVMKHAKGMTAITNPLVNSYKRLVPGYEAPVYIAWSVTNRSPLIRIPASRGNGTRVELRNPDPSANPYLVLATCLAAGLDGIKNKLEVPASVDCNIFEMTEEERKDAGIEILPDNLYDAIKYLNEDKFICGVLGEHITTKYTEAKIKEWDDYKTQVTQWELDEYLYKF